MTQLDNRNHTMDISHLINELNDAQRESVTIGNNNLVVIAGAGSGKTKVLVHRIAWLIQTQNISTASIIAVTFTNKAAAEIRARVESLLKENVNGMWLGTFHSLCHRLLRIHWKESNLPEGFQIIDTDDQLRLIKKIHKELNLDDNQFPAKKSQYFINKNKEQGVRANQVTTDNNPFTKQMIQIYQVYEDHCQRSGLVDFSELILRTIELFKNNPNIIQHYQKRFQHILVDEFQDTNPLQYQWVKLLSATGYVTIVGDDDQSIYSWRGAQADNIYKFKEEFEDVITVKLEQNYRSCGNILTAANALIANNSNRLDKKLWTKDNEGDKIQIYNAYNEIDEAKFIIDHIKYQIENNDKNCADFAILYRSNAQSRAIEEQFNQTNIPYRVYGGLRFYERAEIKDAIGYLRLIINHDDDAAFERIINTPPRGIGLATLDKLREFAKSQNTPLWQASKTLSKQSALTARASLALTKFHDLIEQPELTDITQPLHEQTEKIIKSSGLIEHLQKQPNQENTAKIENLQELITATKQYANQHETETMPAILGFLAHTSLDSDSQSKQPADKCTQLMTLHAAKGLEFDTVFITGLEEELFPHKMSSRDPKQLEEERRLCYVGMTRARKSLFLTYAECRRLYGNENYQQASRFIYEIPAELKHEIRLHNTSNYQNNTHQPTAKQTGTSFQLGQHIKHPKFGEGVILNFEGNKESGRVQVRFYEHGVKWLLCQYAKLETI